MDPRRGRRRRAVELRRRYDLEVDYWTYRALPYYYLLTLYVLGSQESGVARLAFGPTNVFE